jgi:hypothetical protein
MANFWIIKTLKSTATMADAMKGVTRALMRMNQSMNLPAMQKVMMEFERQSEMMDMKEEMMEDCMDDMMGEEDEEGESEEILNQVLDEIGIGLAGQVCFPTDPLASVLCLFVCLYLCLILISLLQMVSAPATSTGGEVVKGAAPAGKTAVAETDSTDSDLLARLDNLRKG